MTFEGPSTTFLIYENGAEQPTREYTVAFTGQIVDPRKGELPAP